MDFRVLLADHRFLSLRVLYVLGYAVEEMAGRSWYSLIHPVDLASSAESHRRLCKSENFVSLLATIKKYRLVKRFNAFAFFLPVQADEGFQVEMVLRLQCKDLSWTWVYIQASKDSGCQSLSCTNFLIRYDDLNQLFPPSFVVFTSSLI